MLLLQCIGVQSVHREVRVGIAHSAQGSLMSLSDGEAAFTKVLSSETRAKRA